jgi:glyceraldehyde-3-phosphate dehydrogenase [NAD(P)+]
MQDAVRDAVSKGAKVLTGEGGSRAN